MKKEKIGNILQMQRGYDLPSSQMNEGEIPVVGSNGIVGYHDVSRCIIPTITIGRSGSAGKVHIYDTPTWVHNTALYLTDFKGNNPQYLYYLLQLLHLEKLCGSSVIPSLNRNVVYPMVVNFHEDRHEQDAIAYTLSLIDEKIALNREINRNLEAMARQLYDYWFVQFDFPDENGRPYKSSGGKMIWNKKLKREIPEGWNVALMKDFLVIGNGKNHKDLETGIYPVYGSGGLMRYVNDFLFSGESVLLPRKGSLSNFMYVNESFWTVDTMFYTKEKLKGAAKYIYYSMRYVDITRYDSGTGVPSMTSISYYAMPFVKPTNDIIRLFDEILSPWIAQIKYNEIQIKNLTKQRDELLPLLMNGQVSVIPQEVNCDLHTILNKISITCKEEGFTGTYNSTFSLASFLAPLLASFYRQLTTFLPSFYHPVLLQRHL